MPVWKDIVNSQDYQDLPLGEKIKTKNEFFKYTISNSDKFKNLSKEQQATLKTNFLTPKPEEGLSPNLPNKASLGEVLKYAVEEFQQKSPFKYLDQPVEQIAQAIEPKTAEEGLMGAAKFIPRQMLAEGLRAYKPSSVGMFGLGAKAIKPIAKPIGRFIASKIPEPIKKLALKELTVGKGQPVQYIQAAKEAELERASGLREAGKVAEILTTKSTGQQLTVPEQQYIGRIFRKETIESPELLAHPRYQELKSISDEGRNVMDKWSTELAKSGIPKEEAAKVIEDNVGSYMARMYSSKLKPKEGGFNLFKDLRLRLGGLKHRKDLSEQVRTSLGEIKEPALPTAIRVKEISTSLANNKLFNKVAQNPEWTSNEAVQGWVKMPDSPSVGPLRNKYVIPEIGEDINAISNVNQQAQGIYSKLLSAWKFGKVVLNPASQVRNVMSNTILLDLSGTNHIRQAQLFPKAFGEFLSKGKLYQQALNEGAVGGEFVGTETMKKLRDFYVGSNKNNFQRWMDVAKMPFQKVGELYQGMEQVSKMVKYMDVLEKTGNNKLAAQEAQKWLFNYNEVPKFIDTIRKSPIGSPFITFTYKSVPRIAETLVNKPMTLYKYYALANAVNETSRKYQGMSPVDFARQKKLLPDYIQKDIGGMPANLLMPWKDKHGRTQWMNLEYILPVGQAPEIMEKGLLKGVVSNPIFNITADLIKNTDFRGKTIVPVESTNTEAAQAILSYVYRQLAPSLAPAIPPLTKGGYSFEKIMDAVNKRPDFAERTKELTPTLVDVLAGIKLTPLDVAEGEGFKIINKQKKIEDLKSQFYRLQNPAISEKERTRQTENIFKKMQRVVEER